MLEILQCEGAVHEARIVLHRVVPGGEHFEQLVVERQQVDIGDRLAAHDRRARAVECLAALARAAEARLRAEAADQTLRDELNRVARDVRLAWSSAQTGFQRLGLTQQLLNNTDLALDLAQQRYKLGLGSIVELSQAQLNQTQARIEQASAKYDYQAQLANLNYQIGALH